MDHLNHVHEDAHENAPPAARPGSVDRVDASANEVRRGRDPHVIESSADPARAPARVQARRQRRQAPAFSITIGEGLTDDEIVDAFARLLLAVSRERPAIASASGASSPRAYGGEEPNHGNG
jgi:hypothetical protein